MSPKCPLYPLLVPAFARGEGVEVLSRSNRLADDTKDSIAIHARQSNERRGSRIQYGTPCAGAAGMVRLRVKGKYHACVRYGISIKHSHAPALPHLPTRLSSVLRPELPEPPRSEGQLVWELAVREPPRRLEVFRKELLLLHCCNDGGVNGLLVCCLALGEGLLRLGLAIGEELLLR